MQGIGCILAPISESVTVSLSLTLEFRRTFFAEGFLTLDKVVTEIAGFDGSVAGGDVPVVRFLDQLVHGNFCCGAREWGVLRDLRGIAFDEFVELGIEPAGLVSLTATNKFRPPTDEYCTSPASSPSSARRLKADHA